MINENATKEEVLEAVKQKGSALCYESEELKRDREVVIEAIKKNVFMFEYPSYDLRSEIVSHWIKHMEENK